MAEVSFGSGLVSNMPVQVPAMHAGNACAPSSMTTTRSRTMAPATRGRPFMHAHLLRGSSATEPVLSGVGRLWVLLADRPAPHARHRPAACGRFSHPPLVCPHHRSTSE